LDVGPDASSQALERRGQRRVKKLWGGRFGKDTEPLVERFSESISFDRELFRQDVRCNIAHAQMLARCGLLSQEELAAICQGLRQIEREIGEGTFEFEPAHEDIHMNIEVALIRRVGEAALKLHTARSRNDQVACDERLWTREAIGKIDELLARCQSALVGMAEAFREVVVPGFTHLQHAQPVLLAHVLLAYVEMLGRDRDRLADCLRRVNVCPLGACALAGTALPIDVDYTAQALGFDAPFENSIDAVSDRDFLVEFVFDLSLIACHLSRLSEEWLLWASPEFDFVDLDESFCTGSSIMPQKKNPDVLELIRGKCGRVYGELVSMLTLLKGLPLAYNRDLQEDKMPLFSAFRTVRDSLAVLAELLPRTTFKQERMRSACERGYLDATALADYLVRKGLAFRDAHRVVGGIVQWAAAQDKRLAELSLAELRRFSELVEEDVFDVLGVDHCIERYRSRGSSSPGEVARQIQRWKARLAETSRNRQGPALEDAPQRAEGGS